MSYRYRILFFHQNQNWTFRLANLIDMPMFQVTQTDMDETFTEALKHEAVDLVLTPFSQMQSTLARDGESLGFKMLPCWQVVREWQPKTSVILLCSLDEAFEAQTLVQDGSIADYIVIENLQDIHRLITSISRAIERKAMIDLIQNRLTSGHKLPDELMERVETLESLMQDHSSEQQASKPAFIPKTNVFEEKSVLEFSLFEAIPEPDSLALGGRIQDSSESFSAQDWLQNRKAADSFGFESIESSFNEFPASDRSLEDAFSSLRHALGRDDGANDAPLSSNEAEGREMSVLLIDTHWENSTSIQRLFDKKWFSVKTIRSVQDALFEVNNSKFDAIISNTELQDEDGMAFLQKIKANRIQPETPLVAVVMNPSPVVLNQALMNGADFILKKPYNASELTRFLNSIELVPSA
jgi:CheY-like chemotaxis protein